MTNQECGKAHITTAESLHPYECGGDCPRCHDEQLMLEWNYDPEIEEMMRPTFTPKQSDTDRRGK